MSWWDAIVDYYKTIGERYSVDPVLFVGIHIVATPLFAAAVWWIIFNKRKKRPLLFPVIAATAVFNAANIYLSSPAKIFRGGFTLLLPLLLSSADGSASKGCK